MTTFVLFAYLCSPTTAQCAWQRLGDYRSQSLCVIAGIEQQPAADFRCKPRVESIPLPRPRPANQ